MLPTSKHIYSQTRQTNKRIMTTKVSVDHVKGAFLGCLVGDAAGGTLEFLHEELTPAILHNAMNMKGGGRLKLGPGQITDDGETSVCLMQALLSNDPAYGFPTQAVFSNYHRWYMSMPFDIGNTCRMAFSNKLGEERIQSYLNVSQANGALMRCSAIAIWAVNEDDDTIAHFARCDAKLSHPNMNCQDCNALYCIALAFLMKHPGQHNACYLHVEEYMKSRGMSIDVLEWFEESKRDLTDYNCTKNIGWIKHGFVLAMYHLRLGSLFQDATMDVLRRLGDSDTNCCIVLGLIGCLHGASAIPAPMKDPLLAFDCTNPGAMGHVRPAMYSASYNYGLLNAFLNRSQFGVTT